MSFWVYLQRDPGAPAALQYQETRTKVAVEVIIGSIGVCYYLYGKQSGSGNIAIPQELDKWSHVERTLEEDFKKVYLGIVFSDTEDLKVTFWMTGSWDHVIWPFWDDVSLTCELKRRTMPVSPTPAPLPSSASLITSTPTETVSPLMTTQVQATWRESYTLFALVVVAILVTVGISGLTLGQLRSKRKLVEAAVTPSTTPRSGTTLPPALDYERLKNEMDVTKRILSKLTDSYSKGIIPEDAYNALRIEYEQEFSRLKTKMRTETESLSIEESRTRKELESLEVKNVAGSMTSEQYQNDKSRLKRDLIERRKASLDVL
ncbi:hypothetical protein KEJ39_03685 [Candidatus Bathyarchaeota archaeon]|nr:hypothetical protein [Candidatus Bathyarchaeota archaeon]